MIENNTNNASAQQANAQPADNGGKLPAEKTFTQDEVNRIVSERLAREREKNTANQGDEREQALRARENRLECRDYLDEKGYPSKLIDVLGDMDSEKFKGVVDALADKFPGIFQQPMIKGVVVAPTGTRSPSIDGRISEAFKPKIKF